MNRGFGELKTPRICPSEVQHRSILAHAVLSNLCPGDEDANRDAGESEMDIQSEKSKHPAVGPEEWDGPSKKSLHVVVPGGLFSRQMIRHHEISFNQHQKRSRIK